jgi:hypothetical protein
MRKSEMSAGSLEDRRIFLQHLAASSWDVEAWDEAHDTGANVEPEAEARYAGPFFDLRLEYHAQHRYLLLELAQPEGVLALSLRLHPSGDVSPLLARITGAQDTIDAENYTEFVKSLLPLCEPLLIETDEGLYRLS